MTPTTLLPNKPDNRSELLGGFQGNWLYGTPVKDFIEACRNPFVLSQQLAEKYSRIFKQLPGISEEHSWMNSLPQLAHVLAMADIDDALILLEYFLPSTQKMPNRVDAIICSGIDHEKIRYRGIELKQWSRTTMKIDMERKQFQFRMGKIWQDTLHPQQQLHGYLDTFHHVASNLDFAQKFENIAGSVFLHNAEKLTEEDKDALYGSRPERGQFPITIFTRQCASRFAERLHAEFLDGDPLTAYQVMHDLQKAAVDNPAKLQFQNATNSSETPSPQNLN